MRGIKGRLCLIWDGENELKWAADVNEDEIWYMEMEMEMAMMKIGMSTGYGAKGPCRISGCTYTDWTCPQWIGGIVSELWRSLGVMWGSGALRTNILSSKTEVDPHLSVTYVTRNTLIVTDCLPVL